MNNFQLEKLLNHLPEFQGVLACDQLRSLSPTLQLPAYFIVNTHPAHMPGEHWLALTLEENGEAAFFDSYGFPPNFSHYPSNILRFLKKRSSRVWYHDRQLQDTLSTTCGQHCVYYICQQARGLSYQKVLDSYHIDDPPKNDAAVTAFVRRVKRSNSSCHNQRRPLGSLCHDVCSLQMFRDCYCL